jgi:glycosyltransferase involved in cell wall biosynthesis
MVASSLGPGGAERVVQLLSRGFTRIGHEVSVVTTAHRPGFYPLPASVAHLPLDLAGRKRAGTGKTELPRWKIVTRAPAAIPELRLAIRSTQPDAVISFSDQVNVATLMALRGTSLPIVVTEHIDPKYHRLAWYWRVMRRLLYPKARFVVSVSNGVDSRFDWVPSGNRRVIHNPVDIPAEEQSQGDASPRLQPGRSVASMGRFHYQKGFDLLLDAFSRVRERHPQWRLVLIGDGPQRDALTRQASRLGLTDSMHFVGRQRDPFPYLRQADIFVLPSRWEGFGNVLVEAMACGLPVVSFDCPSGPMEIISHERDGLLVPAGDVEGLANAIVRLIDDQSDRIRLAGAARLSARRFTLPKIVAKWERQILEPLRSEAALRKQVE